LAFHISKRLPPGVKNCAVVGGEYKRVIHGSIKFKLIKLQLKVREEKQGEKKEAMYV
jgi:hypothetical protein